jgi:hypothetical protein
MQGGINNDEALAYGFMMILLYLGASVLIWFGWTGIIDIILGVSINPAIMAGTVSAQTAIMTGFVVNIIRYAPPLFIILGIIYVTNRSIWTRNNA